MFRRALIASLLALPAALGSAEGATNLAVDCYDFDSDMWYEGEEGCADFFVHIQSSPTASGGEKKLLANFYDGPNFTGKVFKSYGTDCGGTRNFPWNFWTNSGWRNRVDSVSHGYCDGITLYDGNDGTGSSVYCEGCGSGNPNWCNDLGGFANAANSFTFSKAIGS